MSCINDDLWVVLMIASQVCKMFTYYMLLLQSGGMQGSPETPQNITVSKLEQNLAFIAMLIRLLK